MTPATRPAGDWPTLLDLMGSRARTSPDRPALMFLRDGEGALDVLTYADFDIRARRIARGLKTSCPPGSRILLLFPELHEYLLGLFACFAAGMVAISGIPPHLPRAGRISDRHARRMSRFVNVVDSSGAVAALGPSRLLPAFRQAVEANPEARPLTWLEADGFLASGEDPRIGNADLAPESAAFIQYTSGSTGAARGVILSHRALLHNLRHQETALRYGPDDIGVSWLPPFHDMGLIGSGLAPLYSGFPCLFMTPGHFVEKPMRWLKAISEHRGTVSWAPNFAYGLATEKASEADKAELDLSAWRMAMNAAEPVSPKIIAAFEEAFGPCGFRPTTMQPCYGLAEATLLVTSRDMSAKWRAVDFSRSALARRSAEPARPRGDPEDVASLVACGAPQADGALVIVSPETGEPLAAGQVGEIWYSSESVAEGYYGLARQTDQDFNARLGDGSGPYLRTGDLGFLFDDELFIAGRLKDVIIIRGVNFYPQDIEEAVEACSPSLRKGAGAAFSVDHNGEERLVVLCEIERRSEGEAQAAASAIRSAVLGGFGLDLFAVVLLRTGAIFKTPSGKIQRRQCKAAFLAGDLEPVFDWRPPARPAPSAGPAAERPASPDQVSTWILKRMIELGADAGRLSLSDHWSDLGFNSIRLVDMAAEIAQAFGVEIQVAELFELESLAELSAAIWEKLGLAASSAEPSSTPDRAASLRDGRARLLRRRLAMQAG